jgi:hypothetical protein
MNQTEDDIEFLSKYEQFARFIQSIEWAKEAAINDMVDAPTEKLQQISGKIIQCDDILKLANFNKLRRIHDGRLSE